MTIDGLIAVNRIPTILYWFLNRKTTIILTHSGRWRRLELYARWKQGRFSITLLPDDIQSSVVAYLCGKDLLNFLEAIMGCVPRIYERKYALMVPLNFRRQWFDEVVYETFKSHLVSVAESALFYSQDATSVVIAVDWTAFSPDKIKPVAEYSWTRTVTAHANVTVHESQLRETISKCFQKEMCAVRLTMHVHLLWNNNYFPNHCVLYIDSVKSSSFQMY